MQSVARARKRGGGRLPLPLDFPTAESRYNQEPAHTFTAEKAFARRWALGALARGDDAICKSITGPGSLLRAQKDSVRQHLGEHYMRTVWGDAKKVLDYLADDDYHSPGA